MVLIHDQASHQILKLNNTFDSLNHQASYCDTNAEDMAKLYIKF